MKNLIAVGLAALLLAGCASGPPRIQTNETLERYQAYAGKPIDQFFAPSIYSWESLTDDKLVLHTRMNEAYLVTVWNTCPDLRFAQHIRVISTMGSTISRFDKIGVGRDICPISEIRPIDMKRLKADQAKLTRQKAEPKAEQAQ